jgi:twitching motility protein PilT
MPQKTQEEQPQNNASKDKGASATDILFFEKWLSQLGEKKATDIHLTVGNVPMLRIDGKITPLMDEEILTAERIETIVEHLLNEEELDQLSKNKQLIISRTLKKVMRFRIHFSYSRGFLVLSLRHLSSETRSLKELGVPEITSEVITSDQGLFIVSGSFDSGRTTTVKAQVSEINQTQEKYIVTLENPIEHIIPSDKSVVVQREVGLDVESFEEGLVAIKDEDVNIVVVGSIDTAPVLAHVLDLANTGRLVIAIMEGRHSVGVLEELRDMFDESSRAHILNLLGDTLLGITVQLLLPKVGGGRVMIAEVMRATHPVKSLIHENKFSQIPNIIQTSRSQGMIAMDKALEEAVKEGKITIEHAKEHAVDINQFNLLVSH